MEECLRQHGRRPIEEMYQRGILGPSTVIAHAVWLDDREVEVLAQTGTAMTHCPCSNMKLSSGAARIGHYRDRGVVCALGTDGEKENNNLDMLEEMKFASLLQKVSTLDPTTGDPWDILDMATRSGARALGLGDVTGSLEVGKDADVVTVDLRGLHFVPVLHGADFNVAAHLVFTASSHDVRDVWVRGRRVVADGAVVTSTCAAVAARGAGRRRGALRPPPSPPGPHPEPGHRPRQDPAQTVESGGAMMAPMGDPVLADSWLPVTNARDVGTDAAARADVAGHADRAVAQPRRDRPRGP